MCWTFIIQYGTHLFVSQGMEEKAAEEAAKAENEKKEDEAPTEGAEASEETPAETK